MRQLAPRVHLPLRLLALCLDCDECFALDSDTCPACGSATSTSLARFLEVSSSPRPLGPTQSPAPAIPPDEGPEPIRQLLIVARNRGHLYQHLQRAFAENETVHVLLNRRVVERRERSAPRQTERRQGDRRSPLKVDGLLRQIGYAIVPQEAAAPLPTAPTSVSE